MSQSDKVWLGISGTATVVGVVMAVMGMPFGYPCAIIGGLILVTTVTNLSKSE